ncbi:hypothetical protein IEQ34_015136 [Dendrobium chrysotoxum]|uniref:Ubiquitin-like protease family profile domain-containing protein n=1 Tax=Dendrobium chrysotoxum TaxID=161865 RepID=A0AAV7G5T3_DENCH|nr:hypothetical protein IEQ34_015136 [Dendrobium chrysotoxum]
MYQIFLYVSCLHWVYLHAYSQFEMNTKMYVNHINRDSIQGFNLLLLPINYLYQEKDSSFDYDIWQWSIQTVTGVPIQTNSIDCGMFICKYMEAIVQHEKFDSGQHKDWQEKMPNSGPN